MGVRMSPTERQRRLGAELKRMRLSADVSAESAAGLLRVDRSRLSQMEQGYRGISIDRLRTLACNCDCADEAYVEALSAMATPNQRGWWDRYRGSLPAGLLDIAELEAHSPHLRTALTVHIPGLLQTFDHALAIFGVAVPQLPEHELAMRLEFRIERQQVLEGTTPARYTGIVHEAALRMQFGGAQVAKAQLEYLMGKSEQDNITLLAIPFRAGAFPGSGQTLTYAEGPVPQLDTVQVDSTHGPEYLHGETQLAKYRAHLDWMEKITLSPQGTRDLIHSIAQEL
ncbi:MULTISPECIES: helix-turn-helix transcriptional regulator [unclassified Streptomyces]|uniref:helix-turn-helix domain-containing protein n=1 Tax=unclassified Streptomyces TaxID=2593676 RepID=UPI00225AC5F7|nr:helix-turn-helix transcriptional regulator [Streptomyces sp. NBC_00047]MCX5605995.1 helix-turn-helix transcriptional regulator [Streptomyces sp. NBC_00047]